MPPASWGRVLNEIQQVLQTQGPAAVDIVRRQKLAALASITHRPLVIYATACLGGKQVPEITLMIEPSDKLGFQEVTSKINGTQLDVLIHSPGGMSDAAKAIVDLLRSKFTQVRFIIPFFAKSAATMLALSGNEILMTIAAELGPIDPQMPVVLPNGVRMYSPAYALKKQYEQAQNEVNADPTKMPGWIATLSHPSRLIECDLALSQSKRYVQDWLDSWMFAGQPNGPQDAAQIADYLSDHSQFLSHGYPIKWDHPQLSRANILLTSSISQQLDDAIWELYYAIDLTFQMTAAAKIFENSLTPTDCVVRAVQQLQIQVAPQPPTPSPQPGPPGTPSPGTP
jgi:Serine dehydrogenase proteinase